LSQAAAAAAFVAVDAVEAEQPALSDRQFERIESAVFAKSADNM